MKLSKTMTGLSSSLLSKKRLIGMLFGVLVIIVLGGIFFAYMSLRHETLADAAKAINESIDRGDMQRLNTYVDFNHVALSIADAVLQTENTPWQASDRKKLSDSVQTALVKAFMSKEIRKEGSAQNEPAAKSEEPEPEEKESEEDLKIPKEVRSAIAKALAREREKKTPKTDSSWTPITLESRPPFLPKDFILQILDKPFRTLGQHGSMGVLMTTITHTSGGYTVPLKLLLQETPHSWRVIAVANAQEIVNQHRQALKIWRNKVGKEFQAENRRRMDIMIKHYHITSCEAFVAKNLGIESDVPLVVTLEGQNTGKQRLTSAGMTCHLRNRNGVELASVPLNTARVLEPGEPFSQLWQMDMGRNIPETQRLLAEPSLMCDITLSAVSLGNGKIVYEQPPANLDKLLR